MEGLGKSYIVWQEVVDNDIKVLPDTVVNVWKAGWKKEMEKVTSKGLRTILSACWYLNRIQYRIDWDKVFRGKIPIFPFRVTQQSIVGHAQIDQLSLTARQFYAEVSLGKTLSERLNATVNLSRVSIPPKNSNSVAVTEIGFELYQKCYKFSKHRLYSKFSTWVTF